MSGFKKLSTWIFPYKSKLIIVAIFNVLSIFFSIFSIALLQPFLSLLFEQNKLVLIKPTIGFSPIDILDYLNYIVSQIIIEEGKQTALLFITLFILVMFVLKNFFNYLAQWFMVAVRNGAIADIRNAIYDKLLILPLSFYSKNKKGDIISRAITDVQEIEVTILRSIQQFFREPLTILLYLITLFSINYQLTIFVLIFLPIGGFIVGRISRKLRKESVDAKQQLGNIQSIVEQTISGIRVVKAFNAFDFARKIFQKQNQQYTKRMIKIYRRVDLSSPISEFIGSILIMLILVYGGNLVLNGSNSLSAALFITYILLFTQIINPAKTISVAFYNFRKGVASFDRIDHILKADEKIVEIENPLIINSFNNKIVFENVNFAYSREPILKNINLTINKGEVVAICGHSGAGKSTIVDLLPRFYDINSGSIKIDDVDIRDMKISSLRDIFGIVSQDTILFNDSVLNNIAFGKTNCLENEIIEAAKIANAIEFIDNMDEGIYTNIGDRGVKLSGGQRQRISIARAVLKNPPVLILDEATSALDSYSEKLVQEAINNIMKNRTTIIIAHRLSTISSADKIIVLNNGEIVEIGNHQELIQKKGYYNKLIEIQNND